MYDTTMAIESLLAEANGLKKHPDVDKKALNKLIARLEEAWMWSQHLIKSEALANRASLDQMIDSSVTDNNSQAFCSCLPGVRDKSCLVHGGS